ncbi:hypothetical protein TBLA_0A00210 [Henningerozyma blattae CBS 6284]|uniref:Reverse transcriptase domain-containing protein n=1 Tax=Henningerozyma blattae (strain ATCC 34711 / CBS 6284 / DSM 70876 / NBRC 10599 / NRRL Y-10934 / UCD 77-7) TaxID=1071380 RepID=I2GUM1_HENB6|nr:hypothetical protein TBLA_0A00210 [Tetrapisispora blattae CBS 6284]CCH57823.1 hypothetical protein TBLA_0A00210 [Tetrapisispora blattae CBS 6284]
MPFGLCNVLVTFSRYMQQVLGNLPNVYVYPDDVLIASQNKKQQVVLQKLKNTRLICKKKKCHFMQSSVEFLGHTISADGISVLHEKTKAIKHYPMPNTIKTGQSFLGMVNYYRNFIKSCSRTSKPIIQYISKKCEWGDARVSTVNELKEKLSSAPVLVPFVPGDTYRLTTDASLTVIGSVLERTVKGKLKGVIGYYSKTVSNTQSRYPCRRIRIVSYHS